MKRIERCTDSSHDYDMVRIEIEWMRFRASALNEVAFLPCID